MCEISLEIINKFKLFGNIGPIQVFRKHTVHCHVHLKNSLLPIRSTGNESETLSIPLTFVFKDSFRYLLLAISGLFQRLNYSHHIHM